MSTNKLLICTAVTFVYLFLTDFIWYTVVMADVFPASPTARENPLFLYLIIGILIFSFVFCYMYPKGVEGRSKVQQGLRYGILIALLVFVYLSLVYYATDTIWNLWHYFVETIYRIVQLAILGIIVAYLSGIPADAIDREGGRTSGGGEGAESPGSGSSATPPTGGN